MKYLLLLSLTLLSLHAQITLSGSVISDNQKMITSRFMGFVTHVNAHEGERVKKGDILYKIDSKEIDAMKTQVELGISQAKLALSMHQNQYNNTKRNLERYERLFAKDMVSKADVENLALATQNLAQMIEISTDQVSSALTKLDQVQNQYLYLEVKAPNDGVIVAKNIKVGEMAMPGMPAFILTDLSELKISVEIAESELKKITYGQKVQISVPSQKLTTTGVVSAIIPNSNPMTHTFKLKIAFNTQKHSIYPGMYATVIVK
jgi:RND family efflux transporter MFP subunit